MIKDDAKRVRLLEEENRRLKKIEFGLAQAPAGRAAVEAALAMWLPRVGVLDYARGDAQHPDGPEDAAAAHWPV